jgi:molybdopterin/thiamine biosynthesis adenylyltransferase
MKIKNLFEEVTSRNKNLITRNEQVRMKKTVVAFFGLSVGSHAAITWMMQSRAERIIIADPDTIEPSNLNRLRFGVSSVGRKKTSAVAEALQEINPGVKIITIVKTEARDIEDFFKKQKKVDFIVEEIDNLGIKMLLRKIAKSRKIPLLNATDVGNNVFIDVERYDRKPTPKPFLGRVKNSDLEDLKKMDRKKMMSIAVRIVGLENNSYRMLNSLLEIGKTIKTWPQLGATATISGGVITTAITKIISGENVKSGRYIISLDKIFNTEDRPDSLKKAKNNLRLMLNM